MAAGYTRFGSVYQMNARLFELGDGFCHLPLDLSSDEAEALVRSELGSKDLQIPVQSERGASL